jgi:hypothetical protein
MQLNNVEKGQTEMMTKFNSIIENVVNELKGIETFNLKKFTRFLKFNFVFKFNNEIFLKITTHPLNF